VFGWLNDNAAKPYQTKLANITDGTANTLLMAEIIMAKTDSDFDTRGDFLNDDGNYMTFEFMTINPPNGGTDILSTCPNPKDPAPCATGSKMHLAARSRHPGGVNALFADGSVRWAANDFSTTIWQGLGTMNGGELGVGP
jgi:prepilin-type processing-associated H-X9-DG protein